MYMIWPARGSGSPDPVSAGQTTAVAVAWLVPVAPPPEMVTLTVTGLVPLVAYPPPGLVTVSALSSTEFRAPLSKPALLSTPPVEPSAKTLFWTAKLAATEGPWSPDALDRYINPSSPRMVLL